MLNKDSQPTLQRVGHDFRESAEDDIPTDELVVESADSGLESANSTADSAEVGMWVQAIS